ncbi:hypothetical protein [Roseobacter weihaiensis]|uniref:hypothetical protein n=1 Tax=Roseobacter weihaiensis TaxID=2763262 RepID=UPI001D0BD9EF|nr:hypothetical protein [Roseobacter sp. H9]
MAEKPTPEIAGQTGSTRDDRLKAALKANLARRKAQSRARVRTTGSQDNTPDTSGQDKDA